MILSQLATDRVADNIQQWDRNKSTTVTQSVGLQLENQLQHAGSAAACGAQGTGEGGVEGGKEESTSIFRTKFKQSVSQVRNLFVVIHHKAPFFLCHHTRD